MTVKSGQIYVGIGGWNYEPWRGVFYPEGLAQAKELEYAASRLTSIEINSTFYGSQKPESFRKWANAVPNGFVFSVKGPRFATNRRVLAEAGDSIKRFLNSGVLELGDRLGPLLWQFAPTKKFDAADFGKFLELLPAKADGTVCATSWKSGMPSFCTPDFIALLREFGTPIVFTDHATYPSLADLTGDFVYARCKRAKTRSRPPIRRRKSMHGRNVCELWASGQMPGDLPRAIRLHAPKKVRAARRLRLRHSRRQNPRAGRGDGVDERLNRIERLKQPTGEQRKPALSRVTKAAHPLRHHRVAPCGVRADRLIDDPVGRTQPVHQHAHDVKRKIRRAAHQEQKLLLARPEQA